MSENPHRSNEWPSHGSRRVPWSQDYRSGSRADRMLREITVSLPPQIIRPLTDRKRNQVWGAAAILNELDDLGARIESRARSQRGLDV